MTSEPAVRPNLLKSYALVIVQFGALIALALTGPIVARHPLLLAMEIAALALAAWALLTVRIHNVNVTPDVRQGSQLAREGPFRWIRHPMYASLLALGWGVFLKDISILSGALTAVLTAAVYLTARTEEAENLAKFGQIYRDYMLKTRRFIPFLF